MPANMRRLDGEDGVVEHAVPAADGAAVLVDSEDHAAEVGISRAAR